jgi:hypothetical protein
MRYLTRFLVILMVLFLVAGCGSSDDGVTDETTAAAASTTTAAPTTTTEASLADALAGLAEAKATISTTTTTAARPVVPMTLRFDGKNCELEGPTELTPGPVDLTFSNESDVSAATNFVELMEGKTAEDAIWYSGPEVPSVRHAPPWARPLDTWYPVEAGASKSWTRNLGPGNFFMWCAKWKPFLVWTGPGLTVAEWSD